MTKKDNGLSHNLGTEAEAIIDAYLDRLRNALEGLPAAAIEDIIRELRTHIEDSIDRAGADTKTIRSILEDLGDPEEYAESLKDNGYFVTKSNRKFTLRSSGRILGIPYDVGRPTVSKIASRVWSPADPRIFMPRVFGLGWDINFGAVAVKLGLIRPDDEEGIAFSSVPDRVLGFGLLLPLVVNVLSVLMAIIYFNRLPANVPIHFGISGPDDFSSPIGATAWFLGPSLMPMALIYVSVFLRRTSRLARALSVAFLSFIAIMNCGFYINSTYYALNGSLAFFAALPVIVGVVVLFLILVLLSRVGTREEWRRQGSRKMG